MSDTPRWSWWKRLVVCVAALASFLVASGGAAAAPASAYDARGLAATSPQIATSGSTATARFAVLAQRRRRLQRVVLAVEDARGRRFDFVRERDVTVTRRFAGRARLPRGRYRAWVSYSLDGRRWTRASGVKTFDVSAANADGVALNGLSVSTSGATVTANYAVTTTHAVPFAPVAVAVRDSQGRNFDFGHRWTSVTGQRSFTASRTLAPGTYRAWVAYSLDGSHWVDMGTPQTFTVSGGASSTPPANSTPTPAPTPSPGTGGSTGITPPAGGSWKLAFDDEFNGTALDTSKWDTKYPRSGDMIYSNWNNGEAQWYKPDNVTEGNGYLSLTAKREQTVSPYSGRTFQYTSGMIQSKPSFNFKYGYMEARMWLPKGSGFWPAFWTWASNEQWPPEIDAMEFYGDNPTLTYLTYHSSAGADASKASASDWTAGWHTFAVDWEPGQLTWYIDGVARKTVSASPDLNMYLIANLAIANGSGAPAPNSSTPFPASLKIDYIRVWQH